MKKLMEMGGGYDKNMLNLSEDLRLAIKDISLSNNSLEICEKIESVIMKLTASDDVTFFIYDKENQILNNTKDVPSSLSMINPMGCIGKVFLTKRAEIFNHIVSQKEYIPAYDNPNNQRLRSQIVMPILDKDRLMGIVRVSRLIAFDNHNFSREELMVLSSINSYLVGLIRKINTKSDPLASEKVTKKIQKTLVSIDETNKISNNELMLFLSNTVHDIRTPANSLYGFLELLEEQIEDKRLKSFVINAKESASFINTLTDTILIKTKHKHEESISQNESIDSVVFFSSIANTFVAKMAEKKINYFIFISPNLPKELEVNVIKLKRVLINLIGNAYKFTPKKHTIEFNISYNPENKHLCISVKDTGIGIEEEDQKKLFKAFSQATDTISNEYGGTGLGLALSAEFIAQMGGELKLKSQVNVGSEFDFSIPIKVLDITPSYDSSLKTNKKITILTDNNKNLHVNYINDYLIELGIAHENINIVDKIADNITHLICFENMLTDKILIQAKESKYEMLIIENTLFSLLDNEKTKGFNIVSENSYYADAIYNLIYTSKKKKVLIVDDNKINIILLNSMLESEYIEIDTSLDSKAALMMLKEASIKNNPYDIIYLDKHMPTISGTELLENYRIYEKENGVVPIYAISISGDPEISEQEKSLFNAFVSKPFNKKELKDVLEFNIKQ